MIRIALCDDDNKILLDVSEQIEKYSLINQNKLFRVFSYDSAKALKNALDDGKMFDVFILDVYIGDEIGTVLAKEIRGMGIENPIIFLTTSLEHAPSSFETNTLRYLLKPLDYKKLYEALDVAIMQVEKLSEKILKLKTEHGVESINAAQILYSESYGHYQFLTLENKSQIRVRMTVAELYAILMRYAGFVRVGNAYIINLRNVKNVSTKEVRLYSEITIPIPRGKHLEIKDAFWNFHADGKEE